MNLRSKLGALVLLMLVTQGTAAELAAFHETPVAFWDLAGPSACEVALSVAGRVVATARSAAGLGGAK